MTFDLQSSRAISTQKCIQIEKASAQRFQLFNQDISRLWRFLQRAEAFAFDATINGQRCRILCEDQHIRIVELQRDIELTAGDCVSICGNVLRIKRGVSELELKFSDERSLNECATIVRFIIEKFQSAVAAEARTTAVSGQNPTKIVLALHTIQDKTVQFQLIKANSSILILFKKGMRTQQLVFAGIRRIEATAEFIKFQLLPLDEVFIEHPRVVAQIQCFCEGRSYDQENLASHEGAVGGFLQQALATIEQPTPTFEEIQGSLAMLSNLEFQRDGGAAFIVKFSFSEGIPYMTIENRETLRFQGIKIHADYGQRIVFQFVGNGTLVSAARQQYRQMAQCIAYIDTAIARGVDIPNVGAGKAQVQKMQTQLQKAREQQLSYKQVFKQLNTAIDVQATDTRQKFTLCFAFNGNQLFLRVMQGQKSVSEKIIVFDIVLVKQSQSITEFRVLPIPNIVSTPNYSFDMLFSAWKQFKGENPQASVQ